jgi:hypothetical protein
VELHLFTEYICGRKIHSAHVIMSEMANAYNILVGKANQKKLLGNVRVDGMITLKLAFIYNVRGLSGLSWFRLWSTGRPLNLKTWSCFCINGVEFLDQLRLSFPLPLS